MAEFVSSHIEIRIHGPSINLIGSARVVPFGRAALLQFRGNQENSIDEKVQESKSYFPEEKINIPVNLNKSNVHKYNFYELLGLSGDWADSADVDAIKKAYHKAVLIYHPDKSKKKGKKNEEDRSVFLKIQEAFNCLSNDQKRRAYDSTLPFDESIPTEDEVTSAMEEKIESYFELFDPVFKRNARFAAKKPVPNLGTMDTPLNEVLKFYEYWVHFDSWRDFSGLVTEYNVDNANCREEKRWIQKEIEKTARKHKKKEMDRLISLVMLAQKKDPRIAADKEAKRVAKEKETQKKQEEAQAAQLAAEQAAIEAEKQAVLAKENREKQKKMLSRNRNIFRKLLRLATGCGHMTNSAGEFGEFSNDDVEYLFAKLSPDELIDFNDGMGGEAATKDTSLFNLEGFRQFYSSGKDIIEKRNQQIEAERLAREAKKKAEDAAKAQEAQKKNAPQRAWTREQMSMLAKGVAKHPAGLNNRWQLITKFMNDMIKPNPPFVEEEIIKLAFNAAKKMGK